MTVWRIWSNVSHGAFEYLGEAEGETFEEACRQMALCNETFAADFDPKKLTLHGCPLIPLDRRIDGQKIQFGDVSRDVVARD